ncbi:ntpase (nacht family) [Leptolyngbya sp. Heron Island J]|uniref:NACHT C-terminal helical domain 2-containing protein n=1 Tax=Leptolyngbya sp. Heron Island J TaxID=1385935 RepID=UPI0003B98277|nr:NACHT domain-containing protein [Leptolyngbya sp. Heron Island J]ESA38330.1 ntpase (nacht family) [Leptolyngbya sp. Heron Island J]
MDPLAQSVLTSLVVPIYELMSASGKNLFQRFTQRKKYRQELEIAIREYENRYHSRHGRIKLLGMTEAIDIDSIFTNIKLGKFKDRQFKSIQTLEESHRQIGRRKFHAVNLTKQEAIEIVNEEQFLMILGGPGAGKSTLLRKIGLEALKPKQGGLSNPGIPVFIELKQFTEKNINLENKISEEFDICGFPNAEEFTSKALSQGNLLILLDALDEVPSSNLNDVLIHIKNFVDKYGKNRFVASCRSAACYNSYLNFNDFLITEFDDAQIESFLYKWFQSEDDKNNKTAQKCWDILQKPKNSGAKELAHNPLLLTLLCFVYAGSQNLPKNRASLYDEALDLFMNKWLVEKRVQRNPIYQDLNPPIERAMLSEIAYKGYEADRFFFSEREVVQRITTFLRENLNAPRHLDGEEILRSIEIQQGILVERAHNIHSFSHTTFQEYLTAQYIDDHRQVKKLVTEHLTDSRWEGVFLLVSGLMRAGADELLLSMEEESRKFITTDKLLALLQWTNEITIEWDKYFHPTGKRVAALGLLCALVYGYKREFDSFDEIAKAFNYSRRLTSQLDGKLYGEFDRIWRIVYSGASVNALGNHRKRVRSLDITFRKLQVFQSINCPVLKANLESLKTQFPVSPQNSKTYKILAASVLETWLKAFGLTIEEITLSSEETEALTQYLATNLLIMKCQKASVRVSRSVWEGIVSRMLTVSCE